MAAKFVILDRDTPMMLPPDLRDWISEDSDIGPRHANDVTARFARLDIGRQHGAFYRGCSGSAGNKGFWNK